MTREDYYPDGEEEHYPVGEIDERGRHAETGDPETILRRDRGQAVLSWFVEQDGPVELDAWATSLAAWDEDCPRDEVPRDRVLHFQAWLYFGLVPCLEDEGIVSYEGDAVEPTLDRTRIDRYRAGFS